MTRITRESRGYVVSGPNRGEMQRYVLDISSRAVHGDVNVVEFPRHGHLRTDSFFVPLRLSPTHPRTSSRRDVCYKRLYCVISKSSYTLFCTEHGLRGHRRNNSGRKSQPLPTLTVLEIPICHQAYVLFFENPVGQPPRSILSLRIDHDTQSSNHVRGNLESLSHTSYGGHGR